MKVAFNDFKKEYIAHKKDLDAAVSRVMSSGWFILGPEVKAFEASLAKMLGAKHVIGVANGMEALQISLISLGIGRGDEVITTSLSAVATALAIEAVGATPVFADIDEYYSLDPADIEKKITKKTKAIIPVHIYGQSADMNAIVALAKKYGVRIVEDCAQSIGAAFDKKLTGSFGDIGCFSFYPTKNLGAYGDAGAIATNDDELAEKCRMIRNYGQKNRYEHEVIGLNSRLDEMQAAILSTKLDYLAEDNKRRAEIAAMYSKQLGKIKAIKLPPVRKGAGHVYHLFVIECERRDELQKFLESKDIATLVHYPIPIHKQKCFKAFNALKLPMTEKKVGAILSLPIHPYLSDDEVQHVCDQITEFYGI